MTLAISAEHPVAVFVGTRPEVIKLAPVVRELAARGVPYRLLSSGQHRELLDPILAAFELTPDRDLAVMTADQTLAGLSAALLRGIDGLLEELRPSWAVVQGDTTTVAMAALAAFYRQVRVAHVEAGLRTHVKDDPFPEEINRTLLGDLADLHLAPTAEAVRNLEREGVAPERLHRVGNTVIDALYAMVAAVRDRPLSDFEELDLDGPGLESLDAGRALVLVTGHRRENLGGGFAGIFEGLARVAQRLGDAVEIVYPVHLNPRVREQALAILGATPRVRLIEPLAYPAFVRLLTAARLIVTDSGGVQEEAAALGIPTLVTRRTSERREAIDAGVAELVGVEAAAVEAAAVRLLTDDAYYRSRAVATDVFGDGKAAGRIVDALLQA